jgi:hypothetical protein
VLLSRHAKLVELVCGAAFEIGARRQVDSLFNAAAMLPGVDDFLTAPFLELPIIGGLGVLGNATKRGGMLADRSVRRTSSSRADFRSGSSAPS